MVDYNSAMQESYGFYKKYCGRELTEEEWEQVVEEIQMFIDKWNNSWCKGMILALLALMEQEAGRAERRRKDGAGRKFRR